MSEEESGGISVDTKRKVLTMSRNEDSCLLVFYDTELSKETITQVRITCQVDNVWMVLRSG